MTYNKPEISVLGDATRIILQCSQKTSSGSDTSCGGSKNTAPAYDLDE